MQGRRFRFGLILFVTMICAVSVGLLAGPDARPAQAAVWQGEMIRLHVIARSDSEEDQRVKLAVRDALLRAFGEELQAGSYEEAVAAIEERLGDVQRVAQNEARAQGETGEVRVDFGVRDFPTRLYGDTLVPAGEYQALRVVIGEGEGRNWWCVVYPALCLTDADCLPTAQQAMPLADAESPAAPPFTGALWDWINALFG